MVFRSAGVRLVCSWHHLPLSHGILVRSEQYLQFSGASGILSQHLARMWSGFVQTVGWWSDQCVLCKDYVWSVYDVTKLPNANKLFEQAKHMTIVCDMNGFECVKLSNTKGHLKARISNSHFKVWSSMHTYDPPLMFLWWQEAEAQIWVPAPASTCQHLPASSQGNEHLHHYAVWVGDSGDSKIGEQATYAWHLECFYRHTLDEIDWNLRFVGFCWHIGFLGFLGMQIL